MWSQFSQFRSYASGYFDKESFNINGIQNFFRDRRGLSTVCVVVGAFVSYKLVKSAIAWPRVPRIGDRYVLVTGSAQGFGNDLVKRLDKMGCNVLACCRSEKGTEELRAVTSERCHVFIMDVSNPESVRKGVEYVKSVLPPGQGLWALVNNAGIVGSVSGPPEFNRISDYREIFEVNVYGLVDVTMAFLPLVKAARGRIVNLSSLYGRFAVSVATPYITSKFCVEGFSDALRRSLRSFKVSVHTIEPGLFTTNLSSADNHVVRLDKGWKLISPEMREEYGEEYLTRLKNFIISTTTRPYGNRISHVSDSIVQALFCRYPRARYVVGNDAKYAFLPVNSLPDWLSDWFFDMAGGCPVPAVMKQKKEKHQ